MPQYLNVSGQLKNYRQDFLRASKIGDIKSIELLLKSGINPNNIEDNNGFRPLHIAARNGYITLVELLLEHGASLDERTNYGFTPLHLAAKFGYLDVVRVLLRRGANTRLKTNKRDTPTRLALKNDQSKIASYIIENSLKVVMT